MFHDAEQTVIDYLTPLTDLLVTAEVPDHRPDVFIRVMNTGNKRLSTSHRIVQITLECWNTAGPAAANRLADTVETILSDWELIADSEDGWVSGPVAQRDPESGCARTIMTFRIIQFTE